MPASRPQIAATRDRYGLGALPKSAHPGAKNESTSATVRLRTKVTKGHGSKAAGLAMAFKLIESAQRRWRMVNAPHLVALVRAGAAFVNGKLVERPGDEAAREAPPEAA